MVLSIQKFQSGERVPGTVYRVESLVGSGGMGSVYLVEHVELGRKFVLKALHGHLSSREDLVARLRNEWRALAKLDHPNIVQVTDAGQTSDGLPFYVMESLEGATLGKLLSVEGRIAPKRACHIMSDVLAGLHAAHETGAIHRDIKPPNIFVGKDGATKLLDFGIAKLRDQAARVVTAGGVSIGTPRYMAPEQAEGTKVDGRADIYAAGLVLYEMLVGKGPFAHITDPNDLVMAHISQEPERADFVRSDVPPELADLLQRWLSKPADSRPRTASMARAELDALAQSLAEPEGEGDSEVTLAGAYDAATWGADSGDVSVHPGSAVVPAAPSDPEDSTQFGAAVVTQTMAEPAGAEAHHERLSPPVGPAGTLGWGTTGDELRDEGAPSRANPVDRKKPGRRVSVTPPPISPSRPQGRPGAGGGGLRWVVATAVASFVLAWGAAQLLSDGEAPSAPAPASMGKAEAERPEALPTGVAQDSEPTRNVPADPPVRRPPDEEAVSQPNPKVTEVRVPAATLKEAEVSKTKRETHADSSPKGEVSAPSSPPVAPAPASKPAPAPAPKAPLSPKALPGSGLW